VWIVSRALLSSGILYGRAYTNLYSCFSWLGVAGLPGGGHGEGLVGLAGGEEAVGLGVHVVGAA